jgi:hypothetical protein
MYILFIALTKLSEKVACMDDKSNAHKLLVGKPTGRRPNREWKGRM